MQNTFKEKQFRDDLQQTRRQHRTSSPVDFRSFLESSLDTGRVEETGRESNQAEFAPGVKSPKRLLGEIPFQVDRRILSYIFQGHKRLYGFTVANIPNKIIEVSTHPVTGEIDEGYRLHLTQRYEDLKDKLDQLGYKMALHPRFSEFVINTYGILKDTSDELKSKATIYNDSEFLRKVILTIAPRKLHEDMLILLSCLCNMAGKDGMPLFLW
uniref:Speriolin C-terminal domain-containing protein n=2 Tax=Sphaeramia orbicularis TaxID=375764 RepID=A0A672Z6S6_9TELE